MNIKPINLNKDYVTGNVVKSNSKNKVWNYCTIAKRTECYTGNESIISYKEHCNSAYAYSK